MYKPREVVIIQGAYHERAKRYNGEIGQNIRQWRKQRGLSQSDLGEILGISYQQVQKYECGVNRISAVNLRLAAEALNVPSSILIGDGRVLVE